jgi:hypothetical protein
MDGDMSGWTVRSAGSGIGPAMARAVPAARFVARTNPGVAARRIAVAPLRRRDRRPP